MGRIKGPLFEKWDTVLFNAKADALHRGLPGFVYSPDVVSSLDALVTVAIQISPNHPICEVNCCAYELTKAEHPEGMTHPVLNGNWYENTNEMRHIMKSLGWKAIFSDKTSDYEKGIGAENICKVHWYRSIGWRDFPAFEEYRRHWALSILKSYHRDSEYYKAVMEMVKIREVELPEHGNMKPGHTNWNYSE